MSSQTRAVHAAARGVIGGVDHILYPPEREGVDLGQRLPPRSRSLRPHARPNRPAQSESLNILVEYWDRVVVR